MDEPPIANNNDAVSPIRASMTLRIVFFFIQHSYAFICAKNPWSAPRKGILSVMAMFQQLSAFVLGGCGE